MRKLFGVGLLFLIWLAPLAPSDRTRGSSTAARIRGSSTADGTGGSSAILKTAAEDYWKFLERTSLGLRLRLGLTIDELPDISEKRAREDADFAASLRRRLAQVREADLDHEDALSLAILEKRSASA